MHATAPLGRRPELDGLRAVAVLAVAVFHTGLRVAPGGWVGVDLFFVLSGFLITTLLLEEREARGGIDLRAFWARRALRLLPALGALLACLAGLVVIGAASGSALGGAPWALGYVANWAFALGAPLSPLTHLWSLSVEEQFYVAWPLALVALLRFAPSARRQAMSLVVAIVGVMALRTGLSLTHAVSPSRLYFGSDLRCDALLLGCLLAVGRRAGWTESVARAVDALRWPAIGVLAVVAVSTVSPFEQGTALLFAPVDLAALVVLTSVVMAPDALPVLRWRPLVRLGALSYGIYLWHLPVMFVFGMAPSTRLLLGLPLSIAIAAVSRELVEQPALRWKQRFSRTGPAPGVDPLLVAGT